MKNEDLVLIPFYLDWKFWSFLTAFLALILSQLPPIKLWFKGARLNLDVYRKIHITHKVGNPNAQMHLIVSNSGGRSIRVNGISLKIKGSAGNFFSLPAANFLRSPIDKDYVLFTPFTLKPGDEWAHVVSFFNDFTRHESRRYRTIESDLRRQISAKRQANENKNELVEADSGLVAMIEEFFKSKFNWLDGEYEVVVILHAAEEKFSVTKKFRITIFESESKELRDYAAGYKYGFGVYLDPIDCPGLFLPLSDYERK